MKRYVAQTRAQPKRLYRRQMDAPARLPMGDSGCAGCGEDGLGQTTFRPDGITRGVFDQVQPYSTPDYVTQEPDGVDGLGGDMSSWYEANDAEATEPLEGTPSGDGVFRPVQPWATPGYAVQKSNFGGGWYDGVGDNSGFGATQATVLLDKYLNYLYSYVENKIGSFASTAADISIATTGLKNSGSGWKAFISATVRNRLSATEKALFGTIECGSTLWKTNIANAITNAVKYATAGATTALGAITPLLKVGLGEAAKYVCAPSSACGPGTKILKCPGRPTPRKGDLFDFRGKNYVTATVYEATSPHLEHQVGKQNGTAWEATTDGSDEGWLIYGPSVRYGDKTSINRTATFRLLVDSIKDHHRPTVILDIYDSTAKATVASLDVYRNKLACNGTLKAGSNPWEYFYFDLPFVSEVGHVYQYRVFWRDNTYVRVSHIAMSKEDKKLPDSVSNALRLVASREPTAASLYTAGDIPAGFTLQTFEDKKNACVKAGGVAVKTVNDEFTCCKAYDYETNVAQCGPKGKKCQLNCTNLNAYNSSRKFNTYGVLGQTLTPTAAKRALEALDEVKNGTSTDTESSNLPLIIGGAAVALLALKFLR